MKHTTQTVVAGTVAAVTYPQQPAAHAARARPIPDTAFYLPGRLLPVISLLLLIIPLQVLFFVAPGHGDQ